jgi:hypothetical protein
MRSDQLRTWATASTFAFLLAAISARADDGGISFGGSPHLMSGHASVAMQSEVVHMDIGDKQIKVDCQFVFHNSGPAATVRMGFPDQGKGAAEPYQGDPLPPLSKLKATFITYDSYVDGKKVPTKLIPGSDREHFWHTKTVTFKANSDCHIHDVYTLEPGAQMTSENGMYRQTSYTLHTGSSWHGPIGSADIIVTFAPDVMQAPIELMPLSSVPKKDPEEMKWTEQPNGLVVYDGPCKPTVDGLTLRFSKKSFRPTNNDDIFLCYGFKKVTNMQ